MRFVQLADFSTGPRRPTASMSTSVYAPRSERYVARSRRCALNGPTNWSTLRLLGRKDDAAAD